MAQRKRRRRRSTKLAQLQFSKKLSWAITLFWIIYRLTELVAAVLEPSIAESLISLVAGVDTVMMVNIGFYSGNSVSEKMILAWLDRSKDEDNEGKEDEEQP